MIIKEVKLKAVFICFNWPFGLCSLLVGKFGKIVRFRQICQSGCKISFIASLLYCAFLGISRFFSTGIDFFPETAVATVLQTSGDT